MKYLIINADDFGYSFVFNKSILDLIEKDLISSTTVMVNWIENKQKSQINKLINLKKLHNLSIGLHLELSNLNIKEEINTQYNKFIKIFKFEPSHIDIHKPKNNEIEYIIVQKFCKDKNLPCRNLGFKNELIKMTKNECLNGTDKTIDELKIWLKNLNENESYEILFHPGTYDKMCKSSLNKDREKISKKITIIFNLLSKYNIKLINYFDLKKLF